MGELLNGEVTGAIEFIYHIFSPLLPSLLKAQVQLGKLQSKEKIMGFSNFRRNSILLFLSIFMCLFLPSSPRSGMVGPGNGTIQLESENPAEVFNKASKIAVESGASMSSYNRQDNPHDKKTQITAQFTLPKEKVPNFMSQITELALVRRQSYSDRSYSGQSTEKLKMQIREYEKVLSHIKSLPPDVMKMVLEQKARIQQQLNQAEAQAGQANIKLSIQQLGFQNSRYTNPAALDSRYPNTAPLTPATSSQKGSPLPPLWLIALGVSVVSFLLGFLIGGRKRDKSATS